MEIFSYVKLYLYIDTIICDGFDSRDIELNLKQIYIY